LKLSDIHYILKSLLLYLEEELAYNNRKQI
jgi:hypothetical protein